MIGKYRGNRQAISALVRETEVHRDLYLDHELFELEMEHLFANTWIYVGHDSQVPKLGDYYATTIGAQPVIMVRDTSDSTKVLYNRCPHKGTRLTGDTCGNVGRLDRRGNSWKFRRLTIRKQQLLCSNQDCARFGGHAATNILGI